MRETMKPIAAAHSDPQDLGWNVVHADPSELEKDRIRRIADLLYQASRSIRVLNAVKWPDEVKTGFFARGARELPRVSYRPVDPAPALEAIQQARRHNTVPP